MEYGLRIQCVEAVGDVQVVADIGGSIVRITVPRLPIYVRCVQGASILATKEVIAILPGSPASI